MFNSMCDELKEVKYFKEKSFNVRYFKEINRI